MAVLKWTAAPLLAVVLGCFHAGLLPGSPNSVVLPLIPSGSPTEAIPPWPIFRVAVAVNDFFHWAAWVTTPPGVQAKSLATSYWKSDVTYSLAYHGVLDEIDEFGGRVSCEVVAAKLVSLNQDFLCRLMEAGAGIKVLTEEKNKTYSLTSVGKLLLKDHPNSFRPFLMMINEEARHAWHTAMTESMVTGVSGFKQHFGEEFFDYHSRPQHQKQMAQFDSSMVAFSTEIVGAQLKDWALPSPSATVCDIGGGKGFVLITLAQHYPDMQGMVLDLGPVVERAAQEFESANMSSRLQAVPGSFFDPFPDQFSKCDVFYMKFIMHDWNDLDCVRILKHIRAVAKPGARVASTDSILGIDGPEMETAKRLLDMNMLANNPGGAQERTFSEYANLFKRAGFQAEPRLIKLRDATSIVEVAV